MIQSKITQDHATYTATNYWTPLDDDNDDDEEEKEEINTINKTPAEATPKLNKWTRRPQSARSISNFLATKKHQSGRLFYKTPSAGKPCEHQSRILDKGD